MSYPAYLRLEGGCWVFIGVCMVVTAWPGLLVAETAVLPFALVGVVFVLAWLGIALRRRGDRPLWQVTRWMCAGRVVESGSRRAMSPLVLSLAFIRDVVFWAGGTVVYYVLCRVLHAPQSVSMGAITLGMGFAIVAIGLLELFPARSYVLAQDAATGTTTVVLRHQMMAFGFPELARTDHSGRPIQQMSAASEAESA